MAKSTSQVGINPRPSIPCIPFKSQLCAPMGAGDVVFDAAALVALAVGNGAAYQDGTLPTGVWNYEVDLLHPNSDAKDFATGAVVEYVSETSDACVTAGASAPVDIDPGGSEEGGSVLDDVTGAPVAIDPFEIEVKEGSCVTVNLLLI